MTTMAMSTVARSECMLPDFSAKHIRFDFSAGETRLAHRLFEEAHLWALTGI